jgi:uncharacterized membrane-anchored protein
VNLVRSKQLLFFTLVALLLALSTGLIQAQEDTTLRLSGGPGDPRSIDPQ